LGIQNLLLVKIKIASHNARNQFESPTSRKERKKWGTLRFITEKWATRPLKDFDQRIKSMPWVFVPKRIK
jgi:hypothetical protein